MSKSSRAYPQELQIPRVPNYVLFVDGSGKASVADIPDDVLENLAEGWLSDLVARKREILEQRKIK